MTTAAATLKKAKQFSVRRNVNRRIMRFSVVIGAAGSLLSIVLLIASVYPTIEKSQETNRRTLAEITCRDDVCDSSALTTDWQFSDADYVIDTQTSYVFSVPGSVIGDAARFAPLDYSDTAFIAKFRQPSTFRAPNGEIWRLYSRSQYAGTKQFEIIVGYAEHAAWKMIDSPPSLLPAVDARLKREADKISTTLQSHRLDFHGVRADGFEVVEGDTQRVVDWGPWLPIYLPSRVTVPAPGCRPYILSGDLYFVQTDAKGRLTAISLVSVGGLSWLAILAGFAFLSTSAVARLIARGYLRTYFALRGLHVPTTQEALRDGEGQRVEFKRALSDDDSTSRRSDNELAESVAAFANTNDGIILIGVDDSGHVKGLNFDSKQKDRFEQKIRQLVRNRIRPMPPIQLTFEDLNGFTVAKIAVARGDAQAYLMNGVIYVRSGSMDVQAQPEDLKRLVMEYGF